MMMMEPHAWPEVTSLQSLHPSGGKNDRATAERGVRDQRRGVGIVTQPDKDVEPRAQSKHIHTTTHELAMAWSCAKHRQSWRQMSRHTAYTINVRHMVSRNRKTGKGTGEPQE